MRTRYSADLKAKLVLEVLRGETPLNEIASTHNIHPSLLTRWKTQVISSLPQLFENETSKARQQAKAREKETDELYKQIGKLTTQIEWLKKKSGL